MFKLTRRRTTRSMKRTRRRVELNWRFLLQKDEPKKTGESAKEAKQLDKLTDFVDEEWSNWSAIVCIAGQSHIQSRH